MRLSIIIPALNEESRIGATLDAALAQPGPIELLVVDGGSSDATVAAAASRRVRVMAAARGRANQMNAGAAAASGDVLLFLHADTLPPANVYSLIAAALSCPEIVGGSFVLRFIEEQRDLSLRALALLNQARMRPLPILTGDMGIFVRRVVFEQLGGFPHLPIMEDVAFGDALQRAGRTVVIEQPIYTSARRFLRGGTWRTFSRMLWLYGAYTLGADPAWLASLYRDVR